MSSVLPTDKVLVQRAATLHSAPADMSTVHDTDLLLINRAGVDYKCSFADWKASQKSINKPSITAPAAGAVDIGEKPTITSSAFSGSGTAHASSDWQVTLKTDAAFASPAVQSISDATSLTSWHSGALKENTDYLVRVRYNGSGGLTSPWSDAVAFKTKKTFILMADPGHFHYWRTGDAAFTPMTAPVKIVNFSTANASAKAVGTDGKVYSGDVPGTNTLSLLAVAPTDVAAVACGYNANATSNTETMYLKNDGTLVVQDRNSTVPAPAGKKFKKIGTFGCVTEVFWAIATDSTVWVSGPRKVGSQTTVSTRFDLLTVVLPGGRHIVGLAGAGGGRYDAPNILILADDGTLWCVCSDPSGIIPGLPTTGTTNAAPAQVNPGVTFTAVNTAGGNYQDQIYQPAHGAASAIDSLGNLWYGATDASSNVTGGPRNWDIVPGTTGQWLEPVFGAYSANTPLMGLHKDGYIHVSPQGGALAFTRPTGQTVPTSSLGTARVAQNFSGAILGCILP